jgi:hypothetical protein
MHVPNDANYYVMVAKNSAMRMTCGLMTTTILAEMFIFPERREVPSATTTASTTAAAAATTTPPETETTPETERTPETETTPAEAAEAVGTAATTTSVGGDRKIIINLKDIYRCPATGIMK